MGKPTASDRKSTYARIVGMVDKGEWNESQRLTASFHAEIDRGLREDDLSALESDLLQRGVAMAAAWRSTQDATPVKDWLTFHESARTLVLPVFLEALARAIPLQARALALEELVQSGSLDAAGMLFSQKIFSGAQLGALAKKRPREFRTSPLLDLLLEHVRKPAPRKVWEDDGLLAPRDAGLLAGAEAVASSFALEKKPDAARWLIGLLSARPVERIEIARQLLRDEPAAARLAHALCVEGVGPNGRRDKKLLGQCSALAADVLSVCTEAISARRETAPAALAVSAILIVGIRSAPMRYDATAVEAADAFAEQIGRSRVAELLWSNENSSPIATDLITASSAELYAGAQEYLARLRGEVAALTQDSTADYERYIGRRDLVEALLPLLDRLQGEAREGLYVALFNAGVREIPVSEGGDTFDEYAHETAGIALVPGDPVRVIDAGWYIGTGQNRIILRKARVNAI